jgi:peptidoglycan-associated lipoprotein
MRRGLLLSLSVAMMVSLAGCPSKPKNGECKSSDDCKEQQGYGKVCVEGRCQECGVDTDCQAGFVCRQNKCTPRPECAQDSDCGAGKTCQNERCVVAESRTECDTDAQCGPGRGCEAGRCVAKESAAASACGGDDNAVHFAFDRADLDARARSTLETVASCLKSAKATRVIAEGYCDERGTTEYNLHLGERRAESVRKYLVNLGLEPRSVKTISYGKERPVCTEKNEDCWGKNRRGVVKAEEADRS